MDETCVCDVQNAMFLSTMTQEENWPEITEGTRKGRDWKLQNTFVKNRPTPL